MDPLEVIRLAAVAYLVLVAMLAGSFINLAADRIPRGESVVRPRSHCRSCGRVLNVVDLIPLGGYLLRGGRCATCGVEIGAWSPAVEAACGASMLVSLLLLGLVPGALVGAGLVLAVGVLTVGASVARSTAS